jgi:hypothetical protein
MIKKRFSILILGKQGLAPNDKISFIIKSDVQNCFVQNEGARAA